MRKENKKTGLPEGIVYAPYAVSITGTPSKEYVEFMTQYNKDRQCCPNCGSRKHTVTLMGYVFNAEKPDEYKDKNTCVCLTCKDTHVFHDRIPDLFSKLEENDCIYSY